MAHTAPTDAARTDDPLDGPVIAQGVDEEPIEGNRRRFTGRAWLIVAAFAGFYAAFHVIALNGVSISGLAALPWSIPAEAAQADVAEARAALRTLTAGTADPAAVAAAEERLAQAQTAAREANAEARQIRRDIAAWLPFLPRLPLETWNFRIVHIAGALMLGFTLFAAHAFQAERRGNRTASLGALALLLPTAVAAVGVARVILLIGSGDLPEFGGQPTWASAFPDAPQWTLDFWWVGVPLLIATGGAIVTSWFERREQGALAVSDIVLGLCAALVAIYLLALYTTGARGQTLNSPYPPVGVAFAATAGTALIMELTRRVAGMALVIITGVFIAYVFVAHLLPGFLATEDPESWLGFFGSLYNDQGILGPTTAVSSTYIILFIVFAAFLQASKVGDYFVNFAFAAAGRARGGPAKVAIFASGLMGMINGTSAGNVVATGSLTIPLMKKVGYRKTTSGAIEAAASTGGQIMPPIMGAGAFIMAEITGIPYTEIAFAAIIPAILYFASIYFMVDFEAAKLGMRGMREDELPKLRDMARRVFLFIPIVILIVALFMGYSVIRAGTLATAAAAVVSWLTPYRMGPRSIAKAFEIAGVMSIQIIAVCACAGVIVGVISLTGVGARFSSLLLGIADANMLVALIFAMLIAILLGMGMPTTAAYAVAASVVAPGLVNLGIPPLTAHFFVFYFAVVSAITPPVALASYAAAGISGANAMETSMASFKIGIAAFIVPFMFFYNSALLMEGTWIEVARAAVTATFGVFLLSAGVQGWFLGGRTAWFLRLGLVAAALFMIEGGLISDLIGLGIAAAVWGVQRLLRPSPDTPFAVRGAD